MPERSEQAVMVRPTSAGFLPEMPTISADVIEQALTIGDLSKMPPDVRVRYYLAVCQSAGLNPLTRPFTPMKSQSGELILYANKDCAEQLRAKHRMSLRVLGRERLDELFIVTVEGRLPNGRSEEAQGIVDLTGLKGQALANAILKAETKAKRRVTLALCGLGFPLADEADGHPVRMDWRTGEIPEAPAPVRPTAPLTLAQHVSDLYGDRPAADQAADPPAAPAGKRGGASLIDQITLVRQTAGETPAQLAAYWQKTLTRCQAATLADLPLRWLPALLQESRAWAEKRAAAAAPTADPLPAGEEARALGDLDDWRTQLAQALEDVEDLTLAQQARSLLEDADASQDEGDAMLATVQAALAAQHDQPGDAGW